MGKHNVMKSLMKFIFHDLNIMVDDDYKDAYPLIRYHMWAFHYVGDEE